MDRNLTLYQLSPELAAKVFDRIESFNLEECLKMVNM